MLTFRKEITILLILKLFALFTLWGLFFSHPLSDQLKQSALIQHFIRPAVN